MDATLLLCDYAEAVNGKLYITGGGWSIVSGPAPLSCYVAIRLEVPWTATNAEHQLRLALNDQDGQPIVDPRGDALPIAVEGKFELGRPPGVPAGEALIMPMVIPFIGVPLPSGSYRFQLNVDNDPVSFAAFRMVRPEGYEPWM